MTSRTPHDPDRHGTARHVTFRRRRGAAALAVAGLSLGLASCSLVGTGDDDGGSAGSTSEVVLLTHDSFSLPKKVQRSFEEQTGYDLTLEAVGDGGTLTNQLVLTRDDPLGDVAFGVDNTYASRALEDDVFAAPGDDAAALPEGVEQYRTDDPATGEPTDALTPVDTSSVCVNVDDAWFDEGGLEPPRTLDDLADPTYRGLFVTPAPTSSTPGMAFLLATIAEYGDDWPDYWTSLVDNDVKVVKGWEDAYTVDFTASGGDRPIVLSYDSSPAFTVSDDGSTSTTSALLDTCFRQVEYVGVLEGAANPAGAQALVDFMLTDEVQAELPTSMYVFPVVDDVALPRDWARFAQQPTDPLDVDPAQIAEDRQDWLQEWTDVTSR